MKSKVLALSDGVRPETDPKLRRRFERVRHLKKVRAVGRGM